MTAYRAARKLAKQLRDMYGVSPDDFVAHGREEARRIVGHNVDACVIANMPLDLAEMQVWERGPFQNGMQPYPEVFCEPQNSTTMNFYSQKGRPS